MRNKFFEKLKDYKEEANKYVDERTPSIYISKDNKSVSSKTKIKSKGQCDNMLNEMIGKRSKSIHSQQMPIFTRKISTNRSNFFEIYPRSHTPSIN